MEPIQPLTDSETKSLLAQNLHPRRTVVGLAEITALAMAIAPAATAALLMNDALGAGPQGSRHEYHACSQATVDTGSGRKRRKKNTPSKIKRAKGGR
jgi:hypothetical protein